MTHENFNQNEAKECTAPHSTAEARYQVPPPLCEIFVLRKPYPSDPAPPTAPPPFRGSSFSPQALANCRVG